MAQSKKILKASASADIARCLNLVGTASINADAYLDFISDVITGIDWKASGWGERVGVLIHLAQITYDYYEEYVGLPDNNERRQSLVNTALVGWKYAKEAFDIKLPMGFAMFEEWIVKAIIEGAFRFIVSKTKSEK